MSDQNYAELYEDMVASSQRMREASGRAEQVIFGNADAPDLVVPGYSPQPTWNKRFAGLTANVEQATQGVLDAVLVIAAGDFTTGVVITARNQTVLWPESSGGDGSEYRWTGGFDKTIPPGSTPYTTGGVYPTGLWVDVGTTGLSSRLLNGTAPVGGVPASTLAKTSISVSCVKALQGVTPRTGIQYDVSGFYENTTLGGGPFIYDATRSKSDHTGGSVIAPEALAVWDGTEADIVTMLNWTGSGLGCWVRIGYTHLNQYMFGAPSVGASTPSIQKLFSVVGDVSMLAGDHTVTGLTISLAAKYVKMSKRCKLTLANGSNANIISISASDVTIKGGYLDGNLTNQSANCSCVVAVGNDILIDGVTAVNGYQFGIQTRGNKNKIKRCNVSNVGYVPILVDSLAGQVYKRNRVQDCNVDQSMRPTSHNGSAITLSGAFGKNLHGRVTGCNIVMPIGATISNMIGVQTAGEAYYSIVANNTIEGGFMGISSNGSDFTTIEGNTVISPNTYGIEVAGGKHKTVVGNTVDGGSVTNSGIAVTNDETVGDKDHIVITGNIVAHCTDYGISAVNGTNNLTIDSNDIANINVGSGYGLFLVGVTGLNISDNNLSNGKRAMFLENINDTAISGGQMNGWSSFGIQIRANNAEIDNISITGVTIADNVVNKLNAVTVLGTGTVGANIKVANNIGIPRDYSNFAGNIYNMVSSGIPEGIQVGGVGSTYQRTNGTVGATFYVKESGTGSTGWAAK